MENVFCGLFHVAWYRVTAWMLGLCLFAGQAVAQPVYAPDIQKEKLGRGMVCLRDDDSVAISWRLLEAEENVAFNVYCDGKRLNGSPLTGATFFKTVAPKEEATFEVKSVVDGKEKAMKDCTCVFSPSAKDYISVPLSRPEGGVTPDGRRYTYSANDASVGDVDGDGEYEIILKWDPSNSHDNSHEGYTGNVYLDCYKVSLGNEGQKKAKKSKGGENGENAALLWRIDLGKNIRAGAHYTQFLVYDFDGDGRAEVITKTADGTVDGQGNVVGDCNADWRMNGAIDKEIRGKGNGGRRTNVSGRILQGPEYLTVFEGLTGKALKTVNYEPPRGEVSSWGDNYGNRCDRFLACVAYLDGKHPSAVMCRGYYTKSFLAAYDWDGKDLNLRWLFDSRKEDGYSGQGNHNLRVGDVDGDGCDEITYGSMAVDHDGKGLYTTRMGHGDAIHQYAFYPDSTQLQIWDVHENKKDGSEFRDARTGRVIFQIPSTDDVGRGMAADIDPTNWGLEMWSSSQKGYFDVKGNHHAEDVWIPMNSAVWWDGDLLRELLDRNSIQKWNWHEGRVDMVKDFRAEGCTFNNGTKQNPCLSADIFGDWREEVIVRDMESTELRIYSTTIPTQHRFPSFMFDVPYRESVAAQNVGYNQPPEPGFYFGSDRK
ncbi:MAG: rhamnogalacturonan lyase [Prevotellaceae bacterium]|nr:rhamnogalacturonan lyase [Prevotellaceae bacterium]